MRSTIMALVAGSFLTACGDAPLKTNIPGGDTAADQAVVTSDEAGWTGSGDHGDNDDVDDTDGNGGSDTDSNGSGDSQTWYADCDGDGRGSSSHTRIDDEKPTGDSCDSGGDWAEQGGDCDDSNAAASPNLAEVASDGVDNDCDGSVDEGSSTNTCYRDADGDGYGNASSSVTAASCASGYVTNATDCDDSNSSVHPGGSEGSSGDGVDNDCDGSVDEGTSGGGSDDDLITWYADCDCDGWGADGFTRESEEEPAGDSCDAGGCWSLEGGDCEDSNSSVNPDDGCSGLEEGDAVTITIRVVDAWPDEWDLRILDRDGSETYWFGGSIFMNESDADWQRTFATACGNNLELNGNGDDTEFYGDYLVGDCQGDEDGWLTIEDDESTCSAIEIEIEVNGAWSDVTEFSGDNMAFEVDCD